MKIKKTTNKDRLTVAINVRIEGSHAKIMDEIIRKSFGDQISRSQFLKIALVEKLQKSTFGV